MSSPPLRNRARAWARRQLYSFFSSLGNLHKHPLGTMMTVLVLGIAMLLPLIMYVSLENIGRIDLRKESWGTITVFLTESSDAAVAGKLAMQIDARKDAAARAISPDQGMAEFRKASGFGQALDIFDDNPLPWVIHVTPLPLPNQPLDQAAELLLGWLQGQVSVESVQLDFKWMQRLASLAELGRALVTVLSLTFSLAVVVVVANTIRLDVAARAEEIQVLSLVGAGNSFIRQPFLYSGFWYGALGAVLALVLLNVSLAYLAAPMQQLLNAYGNQFEVSRLGLVQVLVLFGSGGLLGLAGAWLSVQRHLRLLGRSASY